MTVGVAVCALKKGTVSWLFSMTSLRIHSPISHKVANHPCLDNCLLNLPIFFLFRLVHCSDTFFFFSIAVSLTGLCFNRWCHCTLANKRPCIIRLCLSIGNGISVFAGHVKWTYDSLWTNQAITIFLKHIQFTVSNVPTLQIKWARQALIAGVAAVLVPANKKCGFPPLFGMLWYQSYQP